MFGVCLMVMMMMMMMMLGSTSNVHGFIMGLIQDLNNATKKRKQKKKTSRN
jgi:cell shape-determining protein MreD